MPKSDTDQRVIKTKEAIKQAVFDLIREEDFKTLSIKQLTERANINRGTFYLHYENLEMLKETYYEEFIDELYTLFERSVARYQQYPEEESIMTLFNMYVLQYIKENSELFHFLWLTGCQEKYRIKIRDFVLNILFYNKYALMKKEDLMIPKQYYIAYAVSSFMGVVGKWLTDGCQETPEEIAKILELINQRGFITPSNDV